MTMKRRLASGPEVRAGKGRRSALAGPAALVGAVMAVFAVLFWTLPAPAQTKPVRTDPASIAAGETLYDLHCSACHGVGAVGAKGPPLLGVGPAAVDFFLSTGRMPLASPNDEPVEGRRSSMTTRSRRSLLTSTTWTPPTAPPARVYRT